MKSVVGLVIIGGIAVIAAGLSTVLLFGGGSLLFVAPLVGAVAGTSYVVALVRSILSRRVPAVSNFFWVVVVYCVLCLCAIVVWNVRAP